MPLYEYECNDNGHRFERIQKFSDPPIAVCPTCGSAVRKLLSSPAIQFKGSGWYITDYAKKGGGAKESTESKGTKDAADSSKADTAAAKDTPASDSKAAPAKSD